jgi:hypothetical protein
MLLNVVLACGSTFQGVAGWQAGNKMGTASNFNGMGTVNNIFELSAVDFYQDPLGVGFVRNYDNPAIEEERWRCARFYQTSAQSITAQPHGVGYTSNTSVGRILVPIVAPFCKVPTLTTSTAIANYNITGGGTSQALSSVAIAGICDGAILVNATASAAVMTTNECCVLKTLATTDYLIFDAGL